MALSFGVHWKHLAQQMMMSLMLIGHRFGAQCIKDHAFNMFLNRHHQQTMRLDNIFYVNRTKDTN